MGRNKFSAKEVAEIKKLLRLKNSGNRLKQKLVLHDLRVNYGFSISDFNEPGRLSVKPNCKPLLIAVPFRF